MLCHAVELCAAMQAYSDWHWYRLDSVVWSGVDLDFFLVNPGNPIKIQDFLS